MVIFPGAITAMFVIHDLHQPIDNKTHQGRWLGRREPQQVCSLVITNLRCCDSIEGIVIMVCICVEISPELHQEESVLRSLVVQILQSFTFLRELVLDLPHVHRLNIRELRPACL